MAPIDYPQVVLDGTTYFFKFTLAAMRRIEENGIDLDSPPDQRDTIAVVRNLSGQVAACAHVLVDGKLKHAGISAHDFEDMIEVSEIPAIQAVLVEAAGKVLRAANSPSDTTAAVQ
jgi:hypothetical protein